LTRRRIRTAAWLAIGLLAAPIAAFGQADAAERIDQILTRLERRSDGLNDIRCKVRYTEKDDINLTERIKHGTILFLITKPNPKFLIHFERTAVDGILGKQEWYLFDGRWLFEAVERLKQVTQREIAGEGERIDLFDLERAPFPLPFGQHKETILRNFHVELIPPAKGDPPDTDHLKCIPKPNSRMFNEYDRLDFFVHQDLHLPTRIVVTRNKGLEANTAEFPDLTEESINTGVTEEYFTPRSAWNSYKTVVEPMAPPE
jgi:hypothetical protein